MEVQPKNQHITAPTVSHDGHLSPPTPANGEPHRSSKRRSANYVRNPTASPEVISSLIDSLSAISPLAPNLFENLPAINGSVSSPASPNALQTQFGKDATAASRGHSMDYIAYRHSLLESEYLEDAAEPPVIRTAKPPSGYSPITAPKKKEKEKESSLKNILRGAGGSSASLHSVQSQRSCSSIGAISIEAGPVQPSNVSRTSGDSKRSARGHRSLMYMSSRERLRAKDAERKRATVPGPSQMASNSSLRNIQPMLSEDTIKEEPASLPVVAESSRAGKRASTGTATPLRNGVGLLNGHSTSPDEKGLIPERNSSLRHSGSPSRRGKKHGRHGSRHDSYKTKTVPEEEENANGEFTTRERLLQELETEDTEVSRKIRELKKKKLLRDKLTGKLPVGVDAGANSGASHVSPIGSAELSPTSTVSSVSERRAQDPAKAHKVLGITAPSTMSSAFFGERNELRDSHSQAWSQAEDAQKAAPRHTRNRSLTVNDGDDVTRLPIDYALVLQSLDHSDFDLETASSGASSKDTVTGSPSVPSRSKSLAVGGRSAVGRKTTSSIIMGEPNVHKRTTSMSSSGTERPFERAASEGITAPQQRSLHSLANGASPPRQRPVLTKKRWSHPDLPAKAEQRVNSMVDPVKTPAQAVIEERPTSNDSVDLDVRSYLNSPRLSQKIRHPSSGRTIVFSEVGDPEGFAVFCCVGMGLTRYVMAFYDRLAKALNLRLITPDRPGVGGSHADPTGTPLTWPDDVLAICKALRISKFSLLAHSAGAIYALATALRMPQHIRGRVHLLAPWIPPSQMAPVGIHQDQPPSGGQLPRSQRFLRVLPPSLLKVANSTFLGATSASLQRQVPKNSPKNRRKSFNPQTNQNLRPPVKDTRRESIMLMDQVLPNASSLSLAAGNPSDPNHIHAIQMKEMLSKAEQERQALYDEKLTVAIWNRAIANAHPATDLMVCLEKQQTIGFRYEDITRGVVIRHGRKDQRVPVDNVLWLGRLMRRCEVRILENEDHGLMGNAKVMGDVLTEVAKEWEDWTAVVQGKATTHTGRDRSTSRRRQT